MVRFPRSELAAALVREITAPSPLTDAANGVFLAAPRRTGKSTFLQHDLSPALSAAGTVVVYVDLWADRRRDPTRLIAEAIARALEPHLGLIQRAAKSARLESVNVAGAVKIDLSRIGQADGLTLTDALRELRDRSGKKVALIIDEAQHALTSPEGAATMAALKSARDQMNAPGHATLFLVMSGSDRDKLLRLVATNGAPFFGSHVTRMPLLGADFIAHLAQLIEAEQPARAPVDRAMLLEAFAYYGHRPQFLLQSLTQALSPLAGLPQDQRFERAVLEAALIQRSDDESAMASEFLALRPLEQAVLWRMLETAEHYRPYDAAALRFYSDRVGQRVTAQQAQASLEALRDREAPLVWRSARGEYALENAAMHGWHKRVSAAGQWPPEPEDSTNFRLR